MSHVSLYQAASHRRLTLVALSVICVVMASTPAMARSKKSASSKISAELQAELEPSIAELAKSEDAQARQAALLSWGLIIDKKTLPELEALRTSEDAEVRLGAGLALMLARQKKSEEFVVTELGTQGELYLTLRDRVTVLDDGVEWGLLDALLDKKDASVTRDVMRYLATQHGDLFDRLVKMAEDKKESERRAASLEALVAASSSRPDLLSVAKDLSGKKDVAQRQAAVAMLNQLAQNSSQRAESIKLLTQISASDKDEALKTTAFKHLLTMGDVSILPSALERAATTEDTALRALILATALKATETGYKPKYADLKALVEHDKITGAEQVTVFQLAARSGDASFTEKLLTFFQSNTFDERLLAAQSMGHTGDEAMAVLLGASLFEGDARMRLYSAQSLGVLGAESSLKAFQNSLSRERDPAVMLAVIDALGSIATDESARMLRMQTTKSEPVVRQHVVMSYMKQGKAEHAKALELLLRDRDERVRWLAFLATLELDEKKGKALFSSSLKSPPSTWMADMELLSTDRQDLIIKELVRHPSTSVQPGALGFALKHPARFEALLKELVLDPTYKESGRMAILAAMAEQPTPQSMVIIERLAGSEQKSQRLSRMAAWFLVRDTSASMEATLRGMTSKKDPVLRALAIYGLMTKKG